VIRDLRPIYLEELGLVSALGMFAQNTRRNGTQVTFDVTGDERRLPDDAELAIYRIAQAAVNNAVRHAHPKTVVLQVDFASEGVLLTAEDDGTGFVPPDAPGDLAREGHFGLIGMYERATRLGGHLSIRSAPGHGTKLAAFLPYT
jgi:two-component system, NarL family, sensor histidine kinase DegS